MSANQPFRTKKPTPPGIRYDSEALGRALIEALNFLCPGSGETLAKPVARAILKAASYERSYLAEIHVAAGQAVELLLREGKAQK